MAFSDTEKATQAVLYLISGGLSLLGSTAVIWLASRKLLKKQQQQVDITNNNRPVYHCIMLGVCASDVSTSLAFMFSTFLLPTSSPSALPWTVGNEATCTAIGYLASIFTLSSSLFNMTLSFYFWFMVRRKSASDVSGSSRIWLVAMMIAAILLPQSIGVTGLLTHSFNDLEYVTGCWLTEIEYSCHEGETCNRGGNIAESLNYFLLLTILVASAIASINTWRIYASYRRVIHRVQRFDFTRSSSLPLDRRALIL